MDVGRGAKVLDLCRARKLAVRIDARVLRLFGRQGEGEGRGGEEQREEERWALFMRFCCQLFFFFFLLLRLDLLLSGEGMWNVLIVYLHVGLWMWDECMYVCVYASYDVGDQGTSKGQTIGKIFALSHTRRTSGSTMM
jgi:hypothetical protein